jgi:hypothetical protein
MLLFGGPTRSPLLLLWEGRVGGFSLLPVLIVVVVVVIAVGKVLLMAVSVF